MRRTGRVLIWTLGSAIYWIGSGFVILAAGYALPGDCGLEQTPQDLHDCARDVRLVVFVGIAVAALVYGIAVWRFARRA